MQKRGTGRGSPQLAQHAVNDAHLRARTPTCGRRIIVSRSGNKCRRALPAKGILPTGERTRRPQDPATAATRGRSASGGRCTRSGTESAMRGSGQTEARASSTALRVALCMRHKGRCTTARRTEAAGGTGPPADGPQDKPTGTGVQHGTPDIELAGSSKMASHPKHVEPRPSFLGRRMSNETPSHTTPKALRDLPNGTSSSFNAAWSIRAGLDANSESPSACAAATRA